MQKTREDLCLTNKHNVAKNSEAGVIVREDARTVRDVLCNVVYHNGRVGSIRAKTLVEPGLIVEYEYLHRVARITQLPPSCMWFFSTLALVVGHPVCEKPGPTYNLEQKAT